MNQPTSFIDALRQELEAIEARMMDLLDLSRIKRFVNDPDSGVLFLGPEYYWDKATAGEQRLQIELRRMYTAWIDRFQLLFEQASPQTARQIKETDTFVKEWIDKNSSWSVQPTIEQCKAVFHERVKALYDLLQMLDDGPEHELILVPDTNALIFAPDVAEYYKVVNSRVYTVIIVPTVLSELDKLKIVHRDPDFRDKVNSVIKRIKGLRTQGSLLSGVTVNKTITVKMVAQEPSFEKTLNWLDNTNDDDKIIASVIEIQRVNPSARVVIVTADINLQNKAEHASIPFAEPPG